MIKLFHLVWLISIFGCSESGVFTSDADGCFGYGSQEDSPYILPYGSDLEPLVEQGNCSHATHWGTTRFAYDFEMEVGDMVLAARAGEVTTIKNDAEEGPGISGYNEVYIQHEDGTIASYVHLLKDTFLVSEGEMVSQGQELAQSGSSGVSNPHLHFQVDDDDKLIQTLPIVFTNTRPHILGLVQGESYTPTAGEN